MSKTPGIAIFMFDGTSAVVTTPFSAMWLEALKMLVPHTHRHWDAEGRAWTVREPYVQRVLELTEWTFESVTEIGVPTRYHDWAEAMFASIPPDLHSDVLLALVNVLPETCGAYHVLLYAYEALQRQES